MPATSSLLGFALISLGLVLTPGPNMIYLISRSITQGPAAGIVSLGGVALGFVFYIAVLPEFIRPDGGSVMRQTLILSVIYVAIATAIHATIVALAGSLQSAIVTAGNRLAIRRGFAIALVGIAIWFALTTGRSGVD